MRWVWALAVLVGCKVTLEVERKGGGGATSPTGGGGGGGTGTLPGDDDDDDFGTTAPAGAPCGGDCDWTAETVDHAAWGGWLALTGFPSFDADVGPDGEGHVIVYDASEKEVRYVTSSGWAAERLWTTPDHLCSICQIPEVAIEVGSDNVVHVAAAVGSYRYGRNEGGTWATELYPSALADQGQVALTLDDDDLPHVFFDRQYVSWDGADWVAHDNAPDTPSDVAFGADGRVHATWNTNYTLQHGFFAGGQWEYEDVADVGAWDVSMGIGPDEVVHLAFAVADGGGQYTDDLWYADDAEGRWDVSEIDGLGDVDLPSVVVDGAGRTHVAYASDVQNEVVYAWWDEDHWDTDRVATGGAIAQVVLRLDPTTGNPVVFVLDDESESVVQFRGE